MNLWIRIRVEIRIYICHISSPKLYFVRWNDQNKQFNNWNDIHLFGQLVSHWVSQDWMNWVEIIKVLDEFQLDANICSLTQVPGHEAPLHFHECRMGSDTSKAFYSFERSQYFICLCFRRRFLREKKSKMQEKFTDFVNTELSIFWYHLGSSKLPDKITIMYWFCEPNDESMDRCMKYRNWTLHTNKYPDK